MKKLLFWILIVSFHSLVDANEKPYFTSTPDTMIVDGGRYEYMITVADPDNDLLQLIFDTLPRQL